MKYKVKTIDVTVKEWWHKAAGNTYQATRVTINYKLPGERSFSTPFQNGYNDGWMNDVVRKLIERKELSPKASSLNFRRFCGENDIILRVEVIENCKQSEVKEFGNLPDETKEVAPVKPQNFHVFTTMYVGPRGVKGSRIRIRSERFQQTKLINKDQSKRDSLECAQDWLRKQGFNVIGHGEGKNGYFVISDTFKPLK